VLITSRVPSAAPGTQVAAEVAEVLDRRSALMHPAVSLAVSDAVALGIASMFRSTTPSGEVFARFYRNGAIDSDELVEAARVEQGYASPEAHAALHCLIGWVRSRQHRAVVD
jgi:hypothetical protein